jgi:hypothetical protein
VGDGQWLVHNTNGCERKVLILGEEASYQYARGLADTNPNWNIYGSTFGKSNSQNLISTTGNLSLLSNVDGRQLHTGSFTSSGGFTDIVFNAPRATVGWRKETGDLIEEIMNSAYSVLAEGGYMRFSGSGGMPGRDRLGALIKNPPTNYTSHGISPFLSNHNFGIPSYTPLRTGGEPIGSPLTEFSWYVFQRR